MLYMIDNIHNERGTYYTDSTLPGYYIMSVVCILYRYQDSALNHMISDTVRTGNINWLYPPLKKVVPNENYSDFALLSTAKVFSLFY